MAKRKKTGAVTVTVEGAEELRAAFARLERAVRGPALERAAMAGAEVIRDEARRRGPGPAIEVEVVKEADEAVLVGIGPDKDHWYYGFFETGVSRHKITPHKGKALVFQGREGGEVVRVVVDHQGMPAQPFLRPAIDGRKDEAAAAAGEALRREIEAAVRG